MNFSPEIHENLYYDSCKTFDVDIHIVALRCEIIDFSFWLMSSCNLNNINMLPRGSPSSKVRKDSLKILMIAFVSQTLQMFPVSDRVAPGPLHGLDQFSADL